VGFVLMHPTILKTCILPYALVLPWRNTRIFLKMSVNGVIVDGIKYR
jgi:hypothetical protein